MVLVCPPDSGLFNNTWLLQTHLRSGTRESDHTHYRPAKHGCQDIMDCGDIFVHAIFFVRNEPHHFANIQNNFIKTRSHAIPTYRLNFFHKGRRGHQMITKLPKDFPSPSKSGYVRETRLEQHESKLRERSRREFKMSTLKLPMPSPSRRKS